MASRKLTVESDNTIVHYEYEWKIKKISTYCDGLRSTEFSPLKFVPLTLEFKFDPPVKRGIDSYDYNFYLVQLSNEEIPKTVRFEIEINICNNDESMTVVSTIGSPVPPKTRHLFTVNRSSGYLYKDGDSFEGIDISDVMIFQFNFIFFGHNITSRISDTKDDVQFPHNRYTSVCSDLKNMYDSKTMSDLSFVVGKCVLEAHRCVLGARSPVFKKMLESEYTEGKSKRVQINDFDAHVFDCFLRYLYCGDINEKSFDTVWDLYALADKYDVSCLQKDSAQLLASITTAETACRVAVLAYMHSDVLLKNKAVHVIDHNFPIVKKSPEWKNIIQGYPELASEILSYVSSRLG